MKKVLKVFLITLIAVTMLAQISVFADCTFTTDTSYDLSSNKATVTSTVYGINAGEEVTFLVERTDEILYIDQINTDEYDDASNTAATGESASFTYLIPLEKADGTAQVRFASTTNSASSIVAQNAEKDGTVKLNKYTVNYSVSAGGAVAAAEEAEEIATPDAASAEEAYISQALTFYFAPDAGYEADSYSINGGEAVSVAGLTSTQITVTGDMNIVFNFKATTKTENAEAPAFTTNSQSFEGNSAAVMSERQVTQFATIEANSNIIEYGILVSKEELTQDALSALDISALSTTTNIKKFQALGSYNGRYAVQLVNGTSTYLDGTVYVVPYAAAKGSADAAALFTFGDIQTVTYASAE